MSGKLSEKQLEALRVAAERKEVRVIDDFPAGTLRSLAQRGLMSAEHRPERGGYWWYYSITDAGREVLAAQGNQSTEPGNTVSGDKKELGRLLAEWSHADAEINPEFHFDLALYEQPAAERTTVRTHPNFSQFPKDYKTFPELAEYARKRAKVSAARNGHQEFAYWLRIAQWAEDHGDISPHSDFRYYQAGLNLAVANGKYSLASQLYAYAVHCRQMMLNRGESVPRLSLDWLREAAGKL